METNKEWLERKPRICPVCGTTFPTREERELHQEDCYDE